MAMQITAHDVCDRCGGKHNERQVDVDTLAKEQAQPKEMAFEIRFGSEHYSYSDLCPSCMRTLTKVASSAAPITRSAGRRSGTRKPKGPKTPPAPPEAPSEE
jgi:hypothetical protein